MLDRPGTEERYLRATASSDLRVDADVATDADSLLAAAYASCRGRDADRKRLALRVYRLRATGDMGGARAIADEMSGWIVARSMPSGGRLRRSAPLIKRIQAFDVALTVLKWWQHQACPSCEGRGHPLMPNAPVLDTTRQCPDCRGTGVTPLERLMRQEHAGYARWMAGELDGLCSIVFNDMARLLRPALEL